MYWIKTSQRKYSAFYSKTRTIWGQVKTLYFVEQYCVYLQVQIALSFWEFVLQQFTIATILITEGQKYKKNYKNIKKYTSTNIRCNEKKQESQSEMKIVPIYHLSQSITRQTKLLKQALPCLVREP